MASKIERKKDQHLCEISKQHQEKPQDIKSLWEGPTRQTSCRLASTFSAAAVEIEREWSKVSKTLRKDNSLNLHVPCPPSLPHLYPVVNRRPCQADGSHCGVLWDLWPTSPALPLCDSPPCLSSRPHFPPGISPPLGDHPTAHSHLPSGPHHPGNRPGSVPPPSH